MNKTLTASYLVLLVLFVSLATVTAAAQSQEKGPVDDLLVKGIAFMRSKDLAKAIESLQQALSLDPSSVAVRVNLGLAYNTARRFQDAIDCLMPAISSGQQLAAIYTNLGAAYDGLKRYPDAIDAYTRALQADPDSAGMHYNLGTIYGKFGRFDEAIVHLKEAARLDPKSASICINLGSIYQQSGHNEEAIEAFREAVRRWPDHPAANMALGDAYFHLGRYPEAVAALEQHVECCKENCDLYLTRGFCYLFLQRGEAAAGDARACIDLNGWRTSRSIYMALVGHFGYRMADQEKSSVEILDAAARSANPLAWPFPVVRYLRREIKSEDVLEQAANNDQQTEAHAYIGMDLLLSGLPEQAMDHFRWVVQFGNQSFFEYHLARVEISQIERGTGPSKH